MPHESKKLKLKFCLCLRQIYFIFFICDVAEFFNLCCETLILQLKLATSTALFISFTTLAPSILFSMSLKYQKQLRSFFYGVFSLAVVTATAHAEMKVGVVDMNRIFTEYNKTKRAQADYLVVEKAVNKDLEDRLALLKQEVEKVNQLDAELEKNELSEAALLAKKKEREEDVAKAKKMDEEISEFRSSKQKKFQDEFLEKRKEIISEIMKVIDEQTQIRGFDLVLDKSGLSAGAVPVVLYTRPEFDVSNDIIAILNKKDVPKKDEKKP